MKKIERNRCIVALVGVVLALHSGFFKHDIPVNYSNIELAIGTALCLIPAIRQVIDEFRD